MPINRQPDLVLYQFAFSHFNEKARWALDWKGLDSKRINLLPGFHSRKARKLSGTTQTPILVSDGHPVAGSTRILESLEETHPTPPLFPEKGPRRDEVERWIGWLDDELGPATRLGLFDELLSDPDTASAIFSTGQAGWKRGPYRWLFPKMIPMLRKDMSVTTEAAKIANDKTLGALARIATATESTGYLVGDHFTAADLTAAAFLFPLSFPPETDIPMPTAPSAALEHWRARWAGKPGVAWMEKIYREHRRR